MSQRVTSPDPCDNCGENDNITVSRYVPWLEAHRMVCESCLFGNCDLFGRSRSGAHWNGAEH
ncbi:hypothetical protein [Halococcus saccharolyticus]|uniref:hypothetical protein n=1 Tax=Halococcus saccharolyticus TaxID=62319 RepID=UPI0006776720|nr:hypothetical protein [Halococcus saccharolyticus]